jgi:nicotine blue oxidoreductase
VAGVLLAAGEGRRFGGPKALAVLDGERLVVRGVRLLTAAGCDPQIVVLGAAAEESQAVIGLEAARVVIAPDWATGMAASLRAGLAAAAAADAQAVVVALVDQPWIEPAAINRLRAAWTTGAAAAVATYDGQPQNPVLLDRSMFEQVAGAVRGDRGARDWLRAHPDLVVEVDCTGIGDPTDVDTPADLPPFSAI